MNLSQRLTEYIFACFTGLWIESHEHEDALQEIAFSSDSDVEVAVVDWNTEGCEENGTETVEVPCTDGTRHHAIVTCRAPYRLEDLAGTDAAAALCEAGFEIDTNRRSPRDDTGLFALYDLDRGELVSATIFCSYSEAADEIDPRQTNVKVVRIVAE